MSFQRHAKQTDTNQTDIVDGLRKVPGCSVCIVGRPVDLLVGYKGLNYLLEVKAPKGPKGVTQSRRTPAQREFYRTWKGDVREVMSLDEALRVIGVGS